MGLAEFWNSVASSFKNSSEDTLKACRDNPAKCIGQLMLDGLVIIAAYALLVWVVDSQCLTLRKAATFYAMFIFLAFVLRYLDVDFQDQLTRVAGFQLGTKLFMALATG